MLATGVNIIDTAAARARGIPVCNVPEYSTDVGGATVFAALLLELCMQVGLHDRMIHAGEWSKRAWSFWETPLVELAGKRLGDCARVWKDRGRWPRLGELDGDEA